jgi:COP9 signalosome complex subunit 5
MTSKAVQRSWEAENEIIEIDPTQNALYALPSRSEYQQLLNNQPWKKYPNYFTHVRISALALLKMTIHARSGGSIEIMGLMTGYVSGTSIIVTDAFRLPVEGTETRVNAQADADEYMVNYGELSRDGGGQQENPIGWYHSHPGYGCWLSGIDVNTQMQQQMALDPFVAVVVDPDRTVSAGKVEIGAFRTYPESQRPTDKTGIDSDGFQSIPTGKIEDFGAHANSYYALEVTHFKSTLDTALLSLLWNKYWTSTLSQAPLFTNRAYNDKQITDHALKIKDVTRKIKNFNHVSRRSNAELISISAAGGDNKNIRVVKDQPVEQIVKEGNKIRSEAYAGLLAHDVKTKLFLGIIQETKEKIASAQAVEAITGGSASAGGSG